MGYNTNYGITNVYSYFLNPYSYLTPQVYGGPSFTSFQNFKGNQVIANTVSTSDVIAAAPLLNVIDEKPKSQKGDLPEFAPKQHPMRGTIYFNPANQSQIIVKDFYYPKPGPDAFFWVGESLPSCSSESIKKTKNYLLDPYTVGSSDYYREDQPILPAYDGTQGDLVLTLPAGASTSDLKWICVWCRMYAHN